MIQCSSLFLHSRNRKFLLRIQAKVAHLVERDLAKVEVAGSSPVFRSEIYPALLRDFFSIGSPGGGIGRHAGLKILFAAMRVTVQLRSGALFKSDVSRFFYVLCLYTIF